MNVAAFLNLPACAEVRLLPSGGDLRREVRLAHVVDVPDTERWVHPGTLLLSTGLSWPRGGAALSAFGRTLAGREPAAVLLAVPGPFGTFPPEVAQALGERGIPALELPYAVPFVQVVQATHDAILQAQAEVLARSEAIHRALTRAALSGNLGDVAATLSGELGCPAALLSATGAPLTPGPAPDAALARQALARPGAAPRPLAGGVLVPVLLRGVREGGVWLAAAPAGQELAVRAAEHAATVTALLMLAQRDLELHEARLGYAFVDTLFEGQFSGDPTSQERAVRLGFDPAGAYTVALLVLGDLLPLSPDGFARREQAARRLREVLVSLGAAPLISVNLNQVWCLVPGSLSPQRVWARLEGAGPDGAGGGLIYGRQRVGAVGAAQGRAEVLSLAAYARPGELLSYAQVLLPRALSGDREAQADLVDSLLTPLRRSRGGEALIDTMQALCDSGFAQAQTSGLLGIHGNTLRYRMKRVQQLTARSLDDPEVRHLWWLALHYARLPH